MIARGLSSGTICLGCRLRLLRQVNRPALSQTAQRHLASPRSQSLRWSSLKASADSDTPGTGADGANLSDLEEASEEQAYRDFLREEDVLPEGSHMAKPRSRGTGSSRPREPQLERDGNYRSVRHLDLRKRHLSGRKILTETSAKLSSDMLGKPASVLVMRDTGSYRAKRRPIDTEKADRKRDILNFEALIGDQSEPPTEAEVRENINELRPPRSEVILKEKDFRRLQNELEQGFLKEQLSNYLETFKPETESQEHTEQTPASDSAGSAKSQSTDEAQLNSSYPWIKEILPWAPMSPTGVFPAYDDAASRLLHAYLPTDASPKARAAVRIMRECWGLQMEDLATGLGEMSIVLQTQHFVPLIRGSQRFINSIIRRVLGEGEALEADFAARQIRILAPRYKCQTIVAELDALVRKIQTHTFPIYYVTDDASQLTPELLEQVGRITKTHVQLTETRKRFQVAWIQLDSREHLDVENLSHVVFRFLESALQPDPATRVLHTEEAEKMLASGDGRFLIDHTRKDRWAWNDRSATWARLSSPVSAKPAFDTEGAEVELPKDDLPKLSMEIERTQVPLPSPLQPLSSPEVAAHQVAQDEPPLEVSRFPDQPVRWASELRSDTSAVFGHLLTMCTKDAKTAQTNTAKPSMKDLIQRRQIFSPIIPHPMVLADLSLPPSGGNARQLVRLESTILVRFLHNPESVRRIPSLVAPRLELRLSLSEKLSLFESEHQDETTHIVGIHSLRAVHDTHYHDVPLPADAVDVRITQTCSASLEGTPEAMAAWQPISDFLSRSRLDLGASKLEMAATQRFQIPLRLFKQAPESKGDVPQHQDTSQQEEEEDATPHEERQLQDTDPNSIRSTLYDLAGVELHRSISVPYAQDDRFDMVYTAIEAGQGGGRRAELSLRPTSRCTATEAPSESGDRLHDDYVKACMQFAKTAKHWSGYKSQHEIS